MTEPQVDGTRVAVRQVEVDSEGAGMRLDQFLMKLLPGVPRNRIFRIVRKGEVRVNGKRAGPEQRLQERDTVRVPPVRIEAEPEPGQPRRVSNRVLDSVGAAIISEDDKILVLDKPAGVAVHGGSGISSGVIEALRALRPKEDLELVHRLDRDTSGCLIVSRKRSALRTLHELLREGLVDKRYLTLVKGHWNLGHTKIDAPLRTDIRVGGERTVKVHESGKQAVSEFRPIQWFGRRATLLEVSLHTGRTHQIRVHAAHAGNPVAGDEKYGDEEFNKELRAIGLERMFLHAHSVSFDWPNGGAFSASAPLPPELANVVDALSSGPREKTRAEGRSSREPVFSLGASNVIYANREPRQLTKTEKPRHETPANRGAGRSASASANPSTKASPDTAVWKRRPKADSKVRASDSRPSSTRSRAKSAANRSAPSGRRSRRARKA